MTEKVKNSGMLDLLLISLFLI